ncbi:hypothetical protein JRO89_XS15G0135200 [Xanthoceras sorbifolium]|uniref:Receptor-like serine/threonine-protein kinase n=1 Tax=Xanthoceras sorbifolium TaxID=99658 RepID=A0ABQ8H209_9ROSI|nr:hypothetical protein JRO89_XS15G0135200 [Xanthoceras sorbifolium]
MSVVALFSIVVDAASDNISQGQNITYLESIVSAAVLTINNEGNLMIMDGRITYRVSENSLSQNTSAILLDSGNLVVRNENLDMLWQSFDYPSNTFLPGMKIGYNRKTGKVWSLTSWKNAEDPSLGTAELKMDPKQPKEYFLMSGSQIIWRSGVWLWDDSRFDLVPEMRLNYIYNFSFYSDENETYFTYSVKDSTISRLLLDTSGWVQQSNWLESQQSWFLFWAKPRENCNSYAYCGPFSSCRNDRPDCLCLQGFRPSEILKRLNQSGGCERRIPLQCEDSSVNGDEDRFLEMNNVEFPYNAKESKVQAAEECRFACFNDCTCTAYAYNETAVCSLWYGELLNLIQRSEGNIVGKTIYIKLAASEFQNRGGQKKLTWVIALVVALSVLLPASYIIYRRRRKLKEKEEMERSQDMLLFDINMSTRTSTNELSDGEIAIGKSKDPGLPLFSFSSSLIQLLVFENELNYCKLQYDVELNIGLGESSIVVDAADSISQGQHITSSESIVSASKIFELGFFTLGNSTNYYLGIWYHKISPQTIVWVANRDQPVKSASAVLTINNEGNLVIIDGRITYRVSDNTLGQNTSALLLDLGNLVVRNENLDILWQSFDYPTNTLLPGMKIGYNRKTGKVWSLTSWKNAEDPSLGTAELKMFPKQPNEYFLMSGSQIIWRSGVWLWEENRFALLPEMRANYILNYGLYSDQNETYISYSVKDSTKSRFLLDTSGQFKQWNWLEVRQEWFLYWSQPTKDCDSYAYCGPFSNCRNDRPDCLCLQGFRPSEILQRLNQSGGCVRRIPLNCEDSSVNGDEDRFLEMNNVEFPFNAKESKVQAAEECRFACFNDCACTAYAYNVTAVCSLWYGELLNLIQRSDDDIGGKTIYIKLAASEIQNPGGQKKLTWVIALVVALSVLLLASYIVYRWRRKLKEKGFYNTDSLNLLGHSWELWNNDTALDLMDPILEKEVSYPMLIRYINVALLCVQETAADRPTMSEVVSMLTNEHIVLPSPKQPAFTYLKSLQNSVPPKSRPGTCSANNVTHSLIEPR